ncbi:MAG: CoA transferase [Caldimonas sp.]|nr:CoA transferase [Pseudomonadota bacterium]
MSDSATGAVAAVWASAGLPDASHRLHLSGADPVLPSSFAVGTAAQASLGAAALVATEIGRHRNGLVQDVSIDMREAALECCGAFTLDGRKPELWDRLAGIYACGLGGSGGFVRLHTNFEHHRDGVLRLLGLPTGPHTERATIDSALTSWSAERFEAAAAEAGLVVAALRSFETWRRHPQHAAVAELPLVEIERIGDAAPRAWSVLPTDARPLQGLRVLDLTRILAGPVGGRTLAAYGADVMLVNSPHLPNIEAIADTSRGKRSALADLRDDADRDAFSEALKASHVFLQGYRPGALLELGFGPHDVARRCPGIVYVSLSAYGRRGPWAARRGFDSLVQTATGFNADEADAAGSRAPKALPMQILDMASGFLLAFGAQAALWRQQREGGSWHVQVSLARTALWLRELGRIDNGFAVPRANFDAQMETSDSGFGRLVALRHAARFSATSARYARRSSPPGTDPLAWS